MSPADFCLNSTAITFSLRLKQSPIRKPFS
jgi:hypothetical protein